MSGACRRHSLSRFFYTSALMPTRSLLLEYSGPYTFHHAPTILSHQIADRSGIYFFSFLLDDRHIIEYCGITTRSFKTRIEEHMRELLSGQYCLYDFARMRADTPCKVRHGMYGRDKEHSIALFFTQYEEFARYIYDYLTHLQFYLIAAHLDKRTLERVEARIYQLLRESDQSIIPYLLWWVRTNPTKPDETPITLSLANNPRPDLLPDQFTC